MRRVVITGMGALTSLGPTSSETFARLIAGESGISPHPIYDLPVQVGSVALDAHAHFSKMQLLSLDRVSQLALIAAEQAMHTADLTHSDIDPLKMGVFWGTASGGTESTEHAYASFFGVGGDRKKPLTVPAAMQHAPAAQIAMRFSIGGE